MNTPKKVLSRILAPISLGELIDKITILEIKKKHMTGKRLENVTKEMEHLQLILQDKNLDFDKNLMNSLKEVNNNLWEIENSIRVKEKSKEFNEDFIHLARSVYKENDKRASIKKEININYKSEIIEEKFYQ